MDKTNNKLYRLDYGSDPVNASPTVTDLGNPGSLLVNPESISLLEQGGNWYGVVGAVDIGGILTRLDFGSDITSTPTGTDLGSFGYTAGHDMRAIIT